MTDQEETPEHSDPEQESEQGSKPKQKRVKARRASVQLQATLDAYDDILSSTTLKEGKRADLLIEKTHTLLQLCQLKQAEDADASLKENAVLKQEIATASTRIEDLEAQVTSLKASQRPVQTVTVPDPEAAQIHRALLDRDDLIKNTAQAIRENVEEPTRLRVAAALCKRSGRGAQSIISEMGVDFASIYQSSQRSTESLETVITQAAPGARGSNIQISKAVLAARGVPIPEVGSFSSKPQYADVFDQIDNGTF